MRTYYPMLIKEYLNEAYCLAKEVRGTAPNSDAGEKAHADREECKRKHQQTEEEKRSTGLHGTGSFRYIALPEHVDGEDRSSQANSNPENRSQVHSGVGTFIHRYGRAGGKTLIARALCFAKDTTGAGASSIRGWVGPRPGTGVSITCAVHTDNSRRTPEVVQGTNLDVESPRGSP